MSIYGYANASAIDINAEEQLAALMAFGVSKENIVIDEQTGKSTARRHYKALVKKLKENDVLVVKDFLRLGKNCQEVLDQWRYITKEKKAALVVLDMPLLDTRPEKGPVSALVSDLIVQLFSYVAESEKEFLHQRQAEGIAAAKARGMKLGRRVLEKPDNYPEYERLWREGAITMKEASKKLGVSQSTFQRWMKKEISYKE